ncbi:hypothetical protein E3U55_16630 [Filobacillus milosensis]|uniref:Uncharacterized protein n=1 Tax=Filobacillus milosensis TaxID=94137 RepID=A0A4Y8IAX7_9BACI|nr:hypothetical protein [Filobacillus milosensis]TFB13111.1 hypothetical protein E3U55_16630 [Filobacillus milosensis]
MTKSTKRILICSVGFILIMLFIYFSSIFSTFVSAYYDSEPVTAETHLKDLREFKNSFENSMQVSTADNINEIAIKKLQYVFDLIDEKLLSKDPSSISIEDLDRISFESKMTRNVLFSEKIYMSPFSEEHKFISDFQKKLLVLENIIYKLKQEKLNQE